jgi:hypothetical protein
MFDNIYYRFDNVFSDNELKTIDSIISNLSESHHRVQTEHGRLCIEEFRLPGPIIKRVTDLVHSVASDSLQTNPSPLFVEYNAKYGTPNLTPHMDGDTNDLIFDFQFKSNTTWGLGFNKDVHELADNSALAFNPNSNIHWRPIKTFNDDEFVQMIFFRFVNLDGSLQPTRVQYSRDNPIYDEIKALRLGAK